MKYISIILIGIAAMSCGKEEEPVCIDESKIEEIAACPQVYAPVCGCDGITYNNTCDAETSGVVTWTEGECPG